MIGIRRRETVIRKKCDRFWLITKYCNEQQNSDRVRFRTKSNWDQLKVQPEVRGNWINELLIVLNHLAPGWCPQWSKIRFPRGSLFLPVLGALFGTLCDHFLGHFGITFLGHFGTTFWIPRISQNWAYEKFDLNLYFMCKQNKNMKYFVKLNYENLIFLNYLHF